MPGYVLLCLQISPPGFSSLHYGMAPEKKDWTAAWRGRGLRVQRSEGLDLPITGKPCSFRLVGAWDVRTVFKSRPHLGT